MKLLINCLSIVAVALAAADDLLQAVEKQLPVLNTQEVDVEKLQNDEAVLLLFSSDKCKRCKTSAEELLRVQEETLKYLRDAGLNTSLSFYETDISDNPKLAKFLRVDGVPTISLIKRNNAYEYGGSIEEKALGDWLHRRLRPIATELKTVEEVEAFERDHEVSIVAYVNVTGRYAFEQVLEPFRDIPDFAIVNTFKAEQPLKKKVGTLEISKYGLKDKLVHEIPDDFSGVEEWLTENQLPLLGEINLSNLYSYVDTNIRPFLWFVALEEEYKGFRDQMIADVVLNEEFHDKFRFVWINPLFSGQNVEFIENQLMPKHQPGFVITDLDGPGRFTLDKPFSDIRTDEVAQFIRDTVAGKIQRHLLSDTPPEKQSDIIEIVVTSAMESFVRRGTQNNEYSGIPDNLLIIDSAWCESCKHLAVNVAKLMQKLRAAGVTQDCLRVGLLNANTNEIDPNWGFGISKFPTMWLFPGGCSNCVRKANLNKDTEIKSFSRVEFEELENIDEGTVLKWLQANVKCHKLKDEITYENLPATATEKGVEAKDDKKDETRAGSAAKQEL